MRYALTFVVMLLMVTISGDLLAARLSNIADAISSNDYYKMKQLKNVALGAGLFFTAIGGLLYFRHKQLMVPVAVSFVMLLLGSGLIAVKFVL